jgi:SAM-dependent methyltransferase
MTDQKSFMQTEAKNRKLLTAPKPEWERLYVEGKLNPPVYSPLKKAFVVAENIVDTLIRPRTITSVDEIHHCAEQLVDFEFLGKVALVVGCGPTPNAIIDLIKLGYDVKGIEPVADAVIKANSYLAGRAQVISGTAEKMTVPDESQSFVIMENVLEHVDSIRKSLSEVYRILKPGGVLFVRTVNRTRFSITGINWEFTTRFYNWFPDIVKESYVFTQLHYHPELAHFSPSRQCIGIAILSFAKKGVMKDLLVFTPPLIYFASAMKENRTGNRVLLLSGEKFLG